MEALPTGREKLAKTFPESGAIESSPIIRLLFPGCQDSSRRFSYSQVNTLHNRLYIVLPAHDLTFSLLALEPVLLASLATLR